MNNSLFFPEVGFLEFASLLYFIVLIIFGVSSKTRFWFSFPFVVLTVPNAVNKFLPSQFMSSSNYNIEYPVFSIITHIDIYVSLGILLFAKVRLVFLLSIYFLLLLFVVLILYIFDLWYVDSLYGLFQIRYILLIFYLVYIFRNFDFFNYFLKGFSISLVLVFFEALVFSYINNQDFLVSGNFGKNPLGHLFAASSIFYLAMYMIERTKNYTILSVLFFVGLLLNTTRSSLLILITCVLLSFLFYRFRYRFAFKNILTVWPIFILFFFLVILTGLVSLDFDFFERTTVNSSLLSRFITWVATVNIASESLYLGYGPGSWAFIKNNFLSQRYALMLDPHNDIINFVFSYGLILGSLFYYILIILPLRFLYYSFKNKVYLCVPPGLFILYMFFSGLNNSVLWKHQLLVIVCFFSAYIYINKNKIIN